MTATDQVTTAFEADGSQPDVQDAPGSVAARSGGSRSSTHAAIAAAETGAGSARDSQSWRRWLKRGLLTTDVIAIVIAVFGAQLTWLGVRADLSSRGDGVPEVSYLVVSIALAGLWLWVLHLSDSRSQRVIGSGTDEYLYVARSSVLLFGLVAIVAYLLQVDVARGYLLIALPTGLVLLLLGRWSWRQWLVSRRLRGEWAARVVLAGSESSVARVAAELRRSPAAGYGVVGVCIPAGTAGTKLDIPGARVDVLGDLDGIESVLAETGADTVVITGAEQLTTTRIKEISWRLQPGRQHLVLTPEIVDVAGPRLHTKYVSGLPLLHVATPRFSGGQLLGKRIVDLTTATLGVLLISPLLLVLAAAVRVSSPGPVLFRQRRIGHRGNEFTMLKFRSMVVDAEDRLAAVKAAAQQDAGNAVLFKLKDDPRVTRIGKFMRRYSLDELPQLFNVIGGSMSLVGPRPPLEREVAMYDDHVHRRFLVKPGITGLWQVSGRSSLSWEQSVRLDLYYVENWSLVGDLIIVAKTLRAVVAPHHAY